MPRSVNAVASRARRKKMMKHAKGYFGRKKNVWTVAKNQIEKSWLYAFRDRRNRKRAFRSLWIQRINAGAREHGMSYSALMGQLNKAEIQLNR
ncbi:MAG: 50S ribosomal protein L20, partial [Bacteroidota bacterium]